MKAMIFAAGLGTRLGPLTANCPKALIKVGGVTMLERVIDRVINAGVRDIVVNVHHHADMIERFLEERGFEARIRVSSERGLLLDTGGGVVKAAPLLLEYPQEPVLLHNADILTDFPIAEMLSRHLETGADATLLVSAERTSSRALLFDAAGRMAGWSNLSTHEVRSPYPSVSHCRPMAFGGVHIISAGLIAAMAEYGRRKGDVFSLTPFYTETCAQHDYQAYIPSEPYRWIDIGKPETLALARKQF